MINLTDSLRQEINIFSKLIYLAVLQNIDVINVSFVIIVIAVLQDIFIDQHLR